MVHETLLFHLGLIIFSSLLVISTVHGQVGRVFDSERVVVTDVNTGQPMIVLTNGRQNDEKIYQTHPQWTADGQWIIFHSNGRAPGSQVYAVHESTGKIVQLTQGEGNKPNSLCVARKSMAVYYLRDQTVHRSPQTPTTDPAPHDYQLVRLDLESLFADALSGAPKDALTYETVVATLPPGTRPGGGQALDADEQLFYISIHGPDVGKHLAKGEQVWVKPQGMRMGTGPGGLRKIDLKTGIMQVVIDTPFQIGHVQTNPWVSGEIVYCHETGGDAPQRIWTVKADGTGNRPLFLEQPLDWVTHETVVTRDQVMFNLIGHQKRLRTRPTGIAVINLRTDSVEMLGQIDERPDDQSEAFGGFWHCNGSPDGRWAVGDTFLGNLWLIDRRDGRRILLSTDHQMKPDHTHPTFSDDSSRILIQSGHFTHGQHLQLIVIPVPKEMP